ncbi:Eukaryotic translation initiation factor 4E type 2 [Durusdinium trenchii]|uniref:Eukaryotic translation initiation factor 4E type 2 n=1 Tax=Durusdinium trenchii TaxID=1381693 RepID=A0ABP0RZ03_9DINO
MTRLPVSIHVMAVEGVLRREAACIAWHVWWMQFFRVFADFSFLAFAFVLNDQLYIAGVCFAAFGAFMDHGNLLQLLRRPALIVAGSRRSMFGINRAAEEPRLTFFAGVRAAMTLMLVISAILYLVGSHLSGPGVSLFEKRAQGAANIAIQQTAGDVTIQGGTEPEYGSTCIPGLRIPCDEAEAKFAEKFWACCKTEDLASCPAACDVGDARHAAINSHSRTSQLVDGDADCSQKALRWIADCRCLRYPEFFAWVHRNLCFLLPLEDGVRGWIAMIEQNACKLLMPCFCILLAPCCFACLAILFDKKKVDRLELKKKIRVEKENLGRFLELAKGKVFSGQRFKVLLSLELGHFLLDVCLDVMTLLNLAFSQQWTLMSLQFLVLLLSFIQQMRLGFRAIVDGIRQSFDVGYQTDIVLQVLQSEKLVEAFLSVPIQAAALASSVNNLSAIQLTISMFVSILGISKALYKQIHLDLISVVDEIEKSGFAPTVYGIRDTE